MTIEQGEYLGMATVGALISLLAYRWPHLAHSERQLKTFRWTGPLLVLCGGLLLMSSLMR